jgi:hypothetical protein
MRLCLSQAAVDRIGCVVPPLPIPAEDTAADSGGAEGDSVSVAGSLVYDGDFEGKSKRVFLSHLCIKTFILPRQARDKHRERAQKRDAFFEGVDLAVPSKFAQQPGENDNALLYVETARSHY